MALTGVMSNKPQPMYSLTCALRALYGYTIYEKVSLNKNYISEKYFKLSFHK